MKRDTEAILDQLLKNAAALNGVSSIGISGSITPLPEAGEGDIDIFIYCSRIPDAEKRFEVIKQLGALVEDGKFNVFEGGRWGTGDFCLINGVETWLMYFTEEETLSHVEAILNGEYPDKQDNYFYPVGRLAMFEKMSIMHDSNGFLSSLQERLTTYPDKLAALLTEYHLKDLEDVEDLERAVTRKDVLFYHFALDIAIDHFLQGLFAVNRKYFPSRKRTLETMESFERKPRDCGKRLLEVISLGSRNDSIGKSYELWLALVSELKECAKQEHN